MGDDNGQNSYKNPLGDFFANMYQGQIMNMQRPKQRTKPVLEKKFQFESGQNFTLAKVYVHSPTLQFPNTSAFFQLSNVKGSCFCKVSDIEDLESLATFLHNAYVECKTTFTNLRPQEELINSQLNQTAELMNKMRMFQSVPVDGEQE